MKKLLLIIILTLSFSNSINADDIKDFEIEGLSIGYSLLDYVNKNEIKAEKQLNKKIKFLRTIIRNNLKIYDAVQVWWEKNDHKYIITHIGGVLEFDNDIDNCIKKQKEIGAEIRKSFSNSKFDKSKKVYNNNETVHHYRLEFPNGDLITVQCYEFSDIFKKENNYIDNLKVMIVPKKVNDHYLEQSN